MKMTNLKRPPEVIDEMRKQPLAEHIIVRIEELAEVLSDETDWLKVKRVLLNELAPADRQLFTNRDQRTKLHFPFNEFEKNIRRLWAEKTGNILQMPDDKKMDTADPDGYL